MTAPRETGGEGRVFDGIERQLDRILTLCAGDEHLPNLIGALRRSIRSARALPTPRPVEVTPEVQDRIDDALGDVIVASQDLESNGHALTPSHERERNRNAFREALEKYAAALRAQPAGAAPTLPPVGERETRGDLPLRAAQQVNAHRSERWMAGTPGWTVLEVAGELAGEVGELANICKKLRRSELGVPGNKVSDADLLEDARSEVGDVLIVLMLVASKLGIDLDDAVCAAFDSKSEKMGFPERLAPLRLATRPSPAPSGERSLVCAIVESVLAWQTSPFIHPLTCGNDSNHDLLVPVTRLSGAVELWCPDCDWKQMHIPAAVTAAAPHPDGQGERP